MKAAYKTGLKLMEQAEAAFLTTLTEQGLPETRAMLNLRNPEKYPGLKSWFESHQEDFQLYFCTNTSSAKFRQVSQNPNVCVYYCRPEIWQGLLLTGRMEIITDHQIKQSFWQPGWELYYAQGPKDPDYTLLCLKPKTGKLYGELKVQALEFL